MTRLSLLLTFLTYIILPAKCISWELDDRTRFSLGYLPASVTVQAGDGIPWIKTIPEYEPDITNIIYGTIRGMGFPFPEKENPNALKLYLKIYHAPSHLNVTKSSTQIFDLYHLKKLKEGDKFYQYVQDPKNVVIKHALIERADKVFSKENPYHSPQFKNLNQRSFEADIVYSSIYVKPDHLVQNVVESMRPVLELYQEILSYYSKTMKLQNTSDDGTFMFQKGDQLIELKLPLKFFNYQDLPMPQGNTLYLSSLLLIKHTHLKTKKSHMLEIASVFDEAPFKHIGRNPEGLSKLHIASGLGDISQMTSLLEQGADLFALDSKMGISVLHKAVYSANPKAVNLLLKRGALIDIQSPSNGNTPLHDAIYFKNGKSLIVIKVLLQHNPSLAIKNRAGLTALEVSRTLKDTEVETLLVSYLESKFPPLETKLMQSVKTNNFQQTKKLLENPNISLITHDEQGFTPLLWASRQGYVDIMKILLEKGAHPNFEDTWMRANAGHKAAFWGHADAVKLLIQFGLNINAQGGYNGYTPLHDAVARNHPEVVKVLIDAGARIDIQGHDGKTPQSIAQASGNSTIIKMLLKREKQ